MSDDKLEIMPDDTQIVECRNGNKYAIDDVNYRLLKNGAVQDIKTTLIVGLALDSHIISRENASEYSKKRWKEGRKAANLGLQRLNNSQSSLDAWSDVIYEIACIVLAESDNRDKVQAAKFVGQATGLTPTNIDAIAENDNMSGKDKGQSVKLDKETLVLLITELDRLRKDKDRDDKA